MPHRSMHRSKMPHSRSRGLFRTGELCDLDVDECSSSPCINQASCDGSMTDEYRCTCATGYAGHNCDQVNECESTVTWCQNGATCVDHMIPPYNESLPFRGSIECVCQQGYYGRYCSYDTIECASSPCQNGGICHDSSELDSLVAVNDYSCGCPPGVIGENCAVDVDECASTPCMNGATCLESSSGSGGQPFDQFICVCPYGWDGEHCANDVDECTAEIFYVLPCQHDSTCLDSTDTNTIALAAYACSCLSGFAGTHCEEDIDECLSSPCQNAGVCSDGLDNFNCVCPIPAGQDSPGHDGELCETAIDHCARGSGNCHQNAICTYEGPGRTVCECATGYEGSGTECTDIDECHPSPCDIGHYSCYESANPPTHGLPVPTGEFRCDCAVGWAERNFGGHRLCIDDIDECSSSPCQNGGSCVESGDYNEDDGGETMVDYGNFMCVCTAGYNGLVCDTDIDECASNPCTNGTSTCAESCSPAGVRGADCATASSSSPTLPGEYACDCFAGFDGAYCEADIDECLSSPCQNHANCSDAIDAFSCSCAAGFRGEFCEVNIDDCEYLPCEHSAACTDLVNDFNCTCRNGYEGRHCETNVDECATHTCANGGTCVDQIGRACCLCAPGFTSEYTGCMTDLDECMSNPCGDPTIYDVECFDSTVDSSILPDTYKCIERGCDGVWDSGAVLDFCGACGGDNSSCTGCDGGVDPTFIMLVDICGVCGGDGTICLGCDGVAFSNRSYDACGVCSGDNSTCRGCDGVPNSGKVTDDCGVCGGAGSPCTTRIEVEEPMVFSGPVDADQIAAAVAAMTGLPDDGVNVRISIESVSQQIDHGISLPGDPDDFDLSTTAGQAARVQLKAGLSLVADVPTADISLRSFSSSVQTSDGRRRLSGAGGVDVDYTIQAYADISAAFGATFVSRLVTAVNRAGTAIPTIDSTGIRAVREPEVQTSVTFAVQILDGPGGAAVSISTAALQANLVQYVEQGGCASSPCPDTATCQEAPGVGGAYTCHCLSGFEGCMDSVPPPTPTPAGQPSGSPEGTPAGGSQQSAASGVVAEGVDAVAAADEQQQLIIYIAAGGGGGLCCLLYIGWMWRRSCLKAAQVVPGTLVIDSLSGMGGSVLAYSVDGTNSKSVAESDALTAEEITTAAAAKKAKQARQASRPGSAGRSRRGRSPRKEPKRQQTPKKKKRGLQGPPLPSHTELMMQAAMQAPAGGGASSDDDDGVARPHTPAQESRRSPLASSSVRYTSGGAAEVRGRRNRRASVKEFTAMDAFEDPAALATTPSRGDGRPRRSPDPPPRPHQQHQHQSPDPPPRPRGRQRRTSVQEVAPASSAAPPSTPTSTHRSRHRRGSVKEVAPSSAAAAAAAAVPDVPRSMAKPSPSSRHRRGSVKEVQHSRPAKDPAPDPAPRVRHRRGSVKEVQKQPPLPPPRPVAAPIQAGPPQPSVSHQTMPPMVKPVRRQRRASVKEVAAVPLRSSSVKEVAVDHAAAGREDRARRVEMEAAEGDQPPAVTPPKRSDSVVMKRRQRRASVKEVAR